MCKIVAHITAFAHGGEDVVLPAPEHGGGIGGFTAQRDAAVAADKGITVLEIERD